MDVGRTDMSIVLSSAGLKRPTSAQSPLWGKIDVVKISKAFRKSRIKTISEKVLCGIDPDLQSFFNINTPEDLQRAEEMVKD
jgi:hypothetical protein